MPFQVSQEDCCNEIQHSKSNPRGAELFWHSVICDNLHFSDNGSEYIGAHKYYLFSDEEGWVVDAGSLYNDKAVEPWGMFPQAKVDYFPSKVIKISFATTITTHHTKTLPYSLGIDKHCFISDSGENECENKQDYLGNLLHWFIEIEDIDLIDKAFEVWEIDSGTASRRITTYSQNDANTIFYKIETGTDEDGEATPLSQGAFVTYLKDYFPWGYKNPASFVFQHPSCLDTDKLECNNHIRLFEMKSQYKNDTLKEILNTAIEKGIKAKLTEKQDILGRYLSPIPDRVQDLGGFYKHDQDDIDAKIKEELISQGNTPAEADDIFEKNKGRLRAEWPVDPVRRPSSDETEFEIENRIQDYEYQIQIVEAPSPSASPFSPAVVSPSFNIIDISPQFCECVEVLFESNPSREHMNGIYKRATDDCEFDVGNASTTLGTFVKVDNPDHVIRKRSNGPGQPCQWHLIDLSISGGWPAQNMAATDPNQKFDCDLCPCPSDLDWVAPGNDPTVEAVPCPSPVASPVPSPGVESPLPASPSPSPSQECHLYRLCLSPSPSPLPPLNREYSPCPISPSPRLNREYSPCPNQPPYCIFIWTADYDCDSEVWIMRPGIVAECGTILDGPFDVWSDAKNTPGGGCYIEYKTIDLTQSCSNPGKCDVPETDPVVPDKQQRPPTNTCCIPDDIRAALSPSPSAVGVVPPPPPPPEEDVRVYVPCSPFPTSPESTDQSSPQAGSPQADCGDGNPSCIVLENFGDVEYPVGTADVNGTYERVGCTCEWVHSGGLHKLYKNGSDEMVIEHSDAGVAYKNAGPHTGCPDPTSLTWTAIDLSLLGELGGGTVGTVTSDSCNEDSCPDSCALEFAFFSDKMESHTGCTITIAGPQSTGVNGSCTDNANTPATQDCETVVSVPPCTRYITFNGSYTVGAAPCDGTGSFETDWILIPLGDKKKGDVIFTTVPFYESNIPGCGGQLGTITIKTTIRPV